MLPKVVAQTYLRVADSLRVPPWLGRVITTVPGIRAGAPRRNALVLLVYVLLVSLSLLSLRLVL